MGTGANEDKASSTGILVGSRGTCDRAKDKGHECQSQQRNEECELNVAGRESTHVLKMVYDSQVQGHPIQVPITHGHDEDCAFEPS